MAPWKRRYLCMRACGLTRLRCRWVLATPNTGPTPADAVARPVGFGRNEYGTYARGRGANALDVLGAAKAPFLSYVSTRVLVTKTGGYKRLASIGVKPRQLGRGIAEGVSLQAAQKGLTIEQAYIA